MLAMVVWIDNTLRWLFENALCKHLPSSVLKKNL